MDGQIALVTGANKGIGFATAKALLQRGMTVYVGSRDPERGRAAADALGAFGDARAATLDMADEATMHATLAAITAAHGRLDILVNNAGIALDAADAVDADPAVIRRTFDINVHAPARLIQLAAPLLRRSAAARVVNVSSGVGSLAFLAGPSAMPGMKIYAYSLSKLALNGVTTLFADAFRDDGIKVNSANPGIVRTDLSHHMGKQTPDEGAEIIVRLATLADDGPTGGFFSKKGEIPW